MLTSIHSLITQIYYRKGSITTNIYCEKTDLFVDVSPITDTSDVLSKTSIRMT